MVKTPPFYATGKWRVRDPFTVDTDAIYVCKAIRSLDDLEARGIDVFNTFYSPYDISQSDYDDDVARMANIITLMSSTAATLYIPDTYIESYPDTTTMPYSHTVLSVSLGAIPDSLSFNDTREKIQELVKASLGIDAQVDVHVSGNLAEGVDMTTHQAIESLRLQRIANNRSLFAQIKDKEQLIKELKQQVSVLEEIVISNGIIDS